MQKRRFGVGNKEGHHHHHHHHPPNPLILPGRELTRFVPNWMVANKGWFQPRQQEVMKFLVFPICAAAALPGCGVKRETTTKNETGRTGAGWLGCVACCRSIAEVILHAHRHLKEQRASSHWKGGWGVSETFEFHDEKGRAMRP